MPCCLHRSTHPPPGKPEELTRDTTSESSRSKQSLNRSDLGDTLQKAMTNTPKVPQNNSGKGPTSITATRAPAVCQTHNNSCSRARCCHIYSKDAKPKTHTPLTQDLELTRDAGESFQGFSDGCVLTRQGDRGAEALAVGSTFSVCHGPAPTQWKHRGPGVAGATEGPLIPTDAPGVDMPFNLHLK